MVSRHFEGATVAQRCDSYFLTQARSWWAKEKDPIPPSALFHRRHLGPDIGKCGRSRLAVFSNGVGKGASSALPSVLSLSAHSWGLFIIMLWNVHGM